MFQYFGWNFIMLELILSLNFFTISIIFTSSTGSRNIPLDLVYYIICEACSPTNFLGQLTVCYRSLKSQALLPLIAYYSQSYSRLIFQLVKQCAYDSSKIWHMLQTSYSDHQRTMATDITQLLWNVLCDCMAPPHSSAAHHVMSCVIAQQSCVLQRSLS